jgi:hypothetical protein
MDLIEHIQQLPQMPPSELTESDTRARFISPTLQYLGWLAGDIRREPYAGWSDSRGYIDYLLLLDGKPVMAVEAKKVGRTFGVPRNLASQRITSYRKLRATASENLKEALDQCLRYSQYTGLGMRASQMDAIGSCSSLRIQVGPFLTLVSSFSTARSRF